jgi:hypothetical protein
MVAFHFQGSHHYVETNGAGWKCDECRRQGLEARRRCGWLREDERGPRRIVWARGRTATEECPKSLVTPQSLEWIERFFTWKFAGGGGPHDFAQNGGLRALCAFEDMTARDADAFLILEREWRNGEQQST